MKKKNKFNLILVLALALTPLIRFSAFAQASGSHGGVLDEGSYKNYMDKIAEFLITPKGRAAYPMLQQPAFYQMAKSIHPVIKAEDAVDDAGNVRDCVSGIAEGVRYTKCDSRKMIEDKPENRPAIYRIIFHEMLVHAGIEKPVNKYIPSEYPLSASIADHMKKVLVLDWILDAGDESAQSLLPNGILCWEPKAWANDTGGSFMGLKGNYFFWMKPDGEYALVKYRERFYGDDDHEGFSKFIQLGAKPRMKLIEHGKADLSQWKAVQHIYFDSQAANGVSVKHDSHLNWYFASTHESIAEIAFRNNLRSRDTNYNYFSMQFKIGKAKQFEKDGPIFRTLTKELINLECSSTRQYFSGVEKHEEFKAWIEAVMKANSTQWHKFTPKKQKYD